METQITSLMQGVEITLTDGKRTASATIVGLEEAEVRDRVDEFVEIHNLKDKL